MPYFNPARDGNGPTVYVGVNIPARLNELLLAEAKQRLVTRSDVMRWALAARYGGTSVRGAEFEQEAASPSLAEGRSRFPGDRP